MSGGEGVRNPADLTPILDILGDLDGIDEETFGEAVESIIEYLELIEAVTSALPTLSETGGTVTTDGTEQNVYINANPLGVFNPICVKIDCLAHTAGETIVIREYYDIEPGGAGLGLEDTLTFAGAIDPPRITIDLDPNRYGVAVTIEKTGGANRAYPWEVFYEI